jgi:ribosome biogenesis GTPase
MNLTDIGWTSFFEEQFLIWKRSGLFPGRVVNSSGYIYQIESELGSFSSKVSGNFKYFVTSQSDYPVVGDWVILRESEGVFVIEKVLERKSIFSRACSGKRSDEQIIVSNIDIIFIVAGLDGGRNFTPRGIERYITMVYNGGALPVILLNKCDLCIAEELEDFIKLTKVVAGNIDIIPVSALTGTGIYRIKQLLMPGITAAFTGPSGVGKSALINSLMEAFVQKTGETRSSDKRGRHTTSHRELFCLPGGGMLIDTPGLRELMPYGDVAFVDMTFKEISDAALNCRFKNCSHTYEPGCAVSKLLSEGEISYERYQNYVTIKQEMINLEKRKDERYRHEQKARDKVLSKRIKNYYKEFKD